MVNIKPIKPGRWVTTAVLLGIKLSGLVGIKFDVLATTDELAVIEMGVLVTIKKSVLAAIKTGGMIVIKTCGQIAIRVKLASSTNCSTKDSFAATTVFKTKEFQA